MLLAAATSGHCYSSAKLVIGFQVCKKNPVREFAERAGSFISILSFFFVDRIDDHRSKVWGR